MQYRTLGTSQLKVSLLGYGSWALAGKGWGNVDGKEAAQTVAECIDSGITFFDTAPVYGFGRSEEILGRLLAPVRKNVIIATKCGLSRDTRGRVGHDLSRTAVLRDLEGSLARLKTDYVDLYQIHWPDPDTPLEETLETLTGLRDAGSIRCIGVSNFRLPLLRQACALADIVSVQEQYNMLQHEAADELLPFCRTAGLGFICYSPLAQGILAGGIDAGFSPGRRDVRRFNPLFSDRGRQLQAVSFARGLAGPPATTALRFLAAREGISSILVGMTRRKHLRDNLRSLEKIPGSR